MAAEKKTHPLPPYPWPWPTPPDDAEPVVMVVMESERLLAPLTHPRVVLTEGDVFLCEPDRATNYVITGLAELVLVPSWWPEDHPTSIPGGRLPVTELAANPAASAASAA